VDQALEDWDNREMVATVSRQLAAISAIVELHFRKEEEVLLPILDEGLSVEEGHALFETAHGDGGHSHD
jgi:iron-sulfur cluster repair protein YtfE (RIC family)